MSQRLRHDADADWAYVVDLRDLGSSALPECRRGSAMRGAPRSGRARSHFGGPVDRRVERFHQAAHDGSTSPAVAPAWSCDSDSPSKSNDVAPARLQQDRLADRELEHEHSVP